MYSPKYVGRQVSPATYIVRIAIVVIMIAAAATFLHVNNYRPKQTFLSCDRPCHHLDWPMICRVKLTLEVFQSLSKSCGNCLQNETACLAQNCVSADGHKHILLAANRQLPGPSIQVCENDILVVDVVNRLPGKAAAVHWRGQPQIETPCMDGAPLVTQCPISSYTTFQYKFRASAPGTHLWHAHAGADVANGIFGSLIVRQADILEPHRRMYDIDDPHHVILMTQWQQPSEFDDPSSQENTNAVLLVNGKGRRIDGPKVPLTTFTVVPGRRHRFRVANAGGAGSCPIALSIDGHPLLLIALDGHPINPQMVTSITLAKGERADFVIKANQPIATYWMHLQTVKDCKSRIAGSAIFKYKSSTEEVPNPRDRIEDIAESEELMSMTTNPAERCGNPTKLCVTEVQSIRKMPKIISNPKVDIKMYLPINYTIQSSEFSDGESPGTRMLNVNNATFTFPSSPLLTQGDDISQDILCTEKSTDNTDEGGEISGSFAGCHNDVGGTCECVHVRRVPLGATVEIILIDQAGLDDLVYHLHGYSFHVVGARTFGRSMPLDEVKDLDKRGMLFTRNLDCAPLKDTVIVPKFGAVALRFKADNPGYWMLRDEHASQWTRGLDVILQVGEKSDMATAPQDFPKCGSFVGPDYFLI